MEDRNEGLGDSLGEPQSVDAILAEVFGGHEVKEKNPKIVVLTFETLRDLYDAGAEILARMSQTFRESLHIEIEQERVDYVLGLLTDEELQVAHAATVVRLEQSGVIRNPLLALIDPRLEAGLRAHKDFHREADRRGLVIHSRDTIQPYGNGVKITYTER